MASFSRTRAVVAHLKGAHRSSTNGRPASLLRLASGRPPPRLLLSPRVPTVATLAPLLGPPADAIYPRDLRSPRAHPATPSWAIIPIEIVVAGRATPGPRTPETGPRPAAGAPFRRVPLVPT